MTGTGVWLRMCVSEYSFKYSCHDPVSALEPDTVYLWVRHVWDWDRLSCAWTAAKACHNIQVVVHTYRVHLMMCKVVPHLGCLWSIGMMSASRNRLQMISMRILCGCHCIVQTSSGQRSLAFRQDPVHFGWSLPYICGKPSTFLNKWQWGVDEWQMGVWCHRCRRLCHIYKRKWPSKCTACLNADLCPELVCTIQDIH